MKYIKSMYNYRYTNYQESRLPNGNVASSPCSFVVFDNCMAEKKLVKYN